MTITRRSLSVLGRTALVMSALHLGACDKEPAVVQVQSPIKVDETALDARVEKAKADMAQRQKTFEARSREKLDALDKKVDELKVRAQSGSDEAKAAAQRALDELSAQRDEARAALERARTASAQQWDALQIGASHALQRAENAYNAALENLKTK